MQATTHQPNALHMAARSAALLSEMRADANKITLLTGGNPVNARPAKPIAFDRSEPISYENEAVISIIEREAQNYEFPVATTASDPAANRWVFDVLKLRTRERAYRINAHLDEGGRWFPAQCDCPAQVHFCRHMVLFLHWAKTMPQNAAYGILEPPKHEQAPHPADDASLVPPVEAKTPWEDDFLGDWK